MPITTTDSIDAGNNAKEGTLPIIRVGGVPEHFNFPWHMAIEQGLFTKNHVQVEFIDFKEGTGALLSALKENRVDLIVALTEGLVADIAKGSDVRLLGTYVESPLCWAISVGKDSPLESIEDLKGKCFGISRFTSGSHLMAIVLASQRSWNLETDISFRVEGNFENLRNGVNKGTSDAFMWETFTTKPFHDSGEIKRIGDITTPWPCFLLAGLRSVVAEKEQAIKNVFRGLREACRQFHNMPNEIITEKISTRYGLQLEDAKKWYSSVKISAVPVLYQADLQNALEILRETNVIPQDSHIQPESLLNPSFALLQRNIKSVHLYNKPELIIALHGQLQAAGLSKGNISFEDLIPYDQNHYGGSRTLDICISDSEITSRSRIINLGSGLGGPARYIAGRTGSQVLALELQNDLHNHAEELTQRCALTGRVHHVSGDFLKVGQHLQSNSYDAIVSWLTILHIPDRKSLFKQSFELLRPGGILFAEDFYDFSGLSADEKKILQNEVFCPYLPSIKKYREDLIAAGFVIVKEEVMTSEWIEFTTNRLAKWESSRDELIKNFKTEVYEDLHHFYKLIVDLFNGGRLGGVRYVAKKPNY